ncbi:hypothetical protein BS47DRAFT_1365991 [Hydnum rufescens UP504]|uniref:Uncharacterized protein n=1 Tax=Hydnum rufescens UP504 TaxID=1448309 RepID=A0A9P6DMW8_9AGAM|nr:hypothetical protein BS47DRAFT_1365991 [Hydnum rufescens UP504]
MFMHRGFRGERTSHKEWANVSKVIQIKSLMVFTGGWGYVTSGNILLVASATATGILKDLGSLWWLTHARISNGSFHSASVKLGWLWANAVQFTASVSAGVLAIILRSPRLPRERVALRSWTLPHHQTITFPTTTSNSQLRTAADCIKVKAYPMRQQRELGRNSPSPPSDLKVAANEKQTDEVARITGDVETAKARNG